ncbi:MAG: hypothetical protein Q8L48_37020 [Archangium sp.]|nr:hypothetical protein [Archangium sp.]
MRSWLTLVVLLAGSSWAERPKLILLTLTGSGVEPAQLESVTERLATTLQARGVFEVLSTKDVQTLLGLERQKQLLGCSETSSSCIAELGGALGARFVLSGSLVKLGDAFQLTLSTLDAQRVQPVGRSVRLADSLAALMETLPWAVAEATALPAPPEPSRLLPALALGVGGAALVGGGILGIQALTQEASLQGELSNQGALDARVDYERRAAQPAMMKSVALGTLIGGGVLIAVGALLWPRGVAGSGVAVVPTGSGFALAGVLP